MTWTGDLGGALLLGAAVLIILALAELWSRLGRPDPEMTRKLVHLGGGLVCLFFPYLIQSVWVVLLMAGSLSALFALGGRLRFLKCLHGVSRASRGSEYYPLAIVLAFALAAGRPWLYVSSVLVLAVADAFAALIGGRYGVIRFEVDNDEKSLEGSLVFLVIAFLSIHLPLLLLTGFSRPVCVMAALLVATLVTGFEAISTRGLDNLFVPLAVCIILPKITSKPLAEIVYQNLSLAGICAMIGILVWRVRTFNVSGALVLMLFTYGAWSLGSERWALPLIAAFLFFALIWFRVVGRKEDSEEIRLRIAIRALLLPALPLIAANATSLYDLFFAPFVAAVALVLTFATRRLLLRSGAGAGHRFLRAGATGAAAWMVAASVPWCLTGGPLAPLLAIGVVCIAVTVLNELFARPRPAETPEWQASHFLLTLCGAACVLLLHWIGWVPVWAAR